MTSKPLQGFGARSIFIILAIVLIMTLFANAASSAPGYIAGDVNGDGVINVKDVVLVMKHTLGLQFPPLTEEQLRAADINGDGVVNVSDAVEIMKISLGLIESVPMPIVSLEDAVVRVPIGTAIADINFPGTVQANFAGGLKRNISVKWEQVSTPAYNPFVFDEYIFRGELINLPSGVKNPADLKPRARVSFLLRDPWPFPGPDPGQYSLNLVSNPLNSATFTGAGNYAANDRVCVTANPIVVGLQFENWTDAADGSIVSTQNPYCFNMPARNLTLVANFRPLVADWPEELEDQVLAGGGLANLWLVTLTVKPQFEGQVRAITINGENAMMVSTNPEQWRFSIEQDERPTRDNLRGRVTVTRGMPGQIDVIDMTRTQAVYVGAVYDVVVRVYIKPGQSAARITADGEPMTQFADFWRVYLDGPEYRVGKRIEIVAENIVGRQTETLTVR